MILTRIATPTASASMSGRSCCGRFKGSAQLLGESTRFVKTKEVAEVGKPHLTAKQRGMTMRLRAKGPNSKEIGELIDSSQQTAWNVMMKAPTRTVKPFSWSPGPGRLTIGIWESLQTGGRRAMRWSAREKQQFRC